MWALLAVSKLDQPDRRPRVEIVVPAATGELIDEHPRVGDPSDPRFARGDLVVEVAVARESDPKDLFRSDLDGRCELCLMCRHAPTIPGQAANTATVS
jgi:hypothetical protein